MLPDQTNLRIILHRVQRLPILEREAIAVVDESVAVGHVVHEQGPKDIPDDDGASRVLPVLDDIVKRLQGVGGRIVGGPVVFADEIRLVDGGDECDVGFEFGVVGWVVVVGKDVDFLDGEVSLVDTIGAVDDEFVGSELFDVGLLPC